MACQTRACVFCSGLYLFSSQSGSCPREKYPTVRSAWFGGTSFANGGSWVVDAQFLVYTRRCRRKDRAPQECDPSSRRQRYGWRPGLETGSVFFADSRVLSRR